MPNILRSSKFFDKKSGGLGPRKTILNYTVAAFKWRPKHQRMRMEIPPSMLLCGNFCKWNISIAFSNITKKKEFLKILLFNWKRVSQVWALYCFCNFQIIMCNCYLDHFYRTIISTHMQILFSCKIMTTFCSENFCGEFF